MTSKCFAARQLQLTLVGAFPLAGSSMAAPNFITIEICKNENVMVQKIYRDPPKPAAAILTSLCESGLVGELREGSVTLSASDLLKGATYQLHLRDLGVQSLNISSLHHRLVSVKSDLILAA